MRSNGILSCALVALVCWFGCSDPPAPAPDLTEVATDSSPEDIVENEDGVEDFEVVDSGQDGDGCTPGEQVCASARTFLVCEDDGETRRQEQCEFEFGCLDGECVETICDPFEIAGCFNETAMEVCNFSGTDWIAEDCPAFWACEDDVCQEPPCIPDTHRCDGLDRILSCNPATGEFEEQTHCDEGTACYESECQPLCEINKKIRSYVGCEYWTVDLDNLGDAETIEHTVVLSNPSSDIDARVLVVDRFGEEMQLEDPVVPAEGQLVIRFPADQGLIRAGVSDSSWKITSTIPVTAHQFNPLDNFTDPFTNDGTLLLPTHALDGRYYVASWIHREHPVSPLNGFVSILAVDPGESEITVTVPTEALSGDGAANLEPGEQRTWTLEQGQSLTLQTAGIDGDLTGTLVEGDQVRLAVFGGHECANVVLGVDRCDHMETQLLPVALLRNEYTATKYQTRVEDGVRSEPDYWRVLAVEGATLLRTDPEIPGIDGAIIASGEWLEIAFREDFILTADRPVLVAHYMVGANWTGIPRDCFDSTGPPTGIGDPAMTQLVPTEQFRSDYIVLTPFAYVEDYLNLAVPTTAIDSVRLDDQRVDADLFSQIGESDWSAARVLVEDGPHTVTASVPFGLDAYGYSCHVSYAYPGGMTLDGVDLE